jgi:hypothetical protein
MSDTSGQRDLAEAPFDFVRPDQTLDSGGFGYQGLELVLLAGRQEPSLVEGAVPGGHVGQ